jgi:hypothetical protein
MTQSSQRTNAIARKNEQALLQRFNEVPSKNIALATGWHESKVSRFFGVQGDNGKTDAQAVATMLAEMGLTVHPSHHRVVDPHGLDATLGMLKFAVPKLRPEDLMATN